MINNEILEEIKTEEIEELELSEETLEELSNNKGGEEDE